MKRPTALYRFFDGAGVLLYVGITENPRARFAHHRSEKPWWPTVADHTLVWFETREEALAAEIAAIEAEMPRWNVAGSPNPPEKPIATWLRSAIDAGLTYSITETKRRFADLIAATQQGRPTFLLAYGKPQAAIVPVELAEAVRDAGGPDTAAQILRDHIAASG